MSNCQVPRPLGFTLIEIMIVVSIMGVLMAAAIPSFNSYNRNQVLAQAVKSLRTDLRAVQNYAISGADAKVWGVHLNSASSVYQVFKCLPGTPNGDSRTEYRYDPLIYPDCTLVRTQNLGSIIKVTSANLDLAFETVSANIYVNGVVPAATTDVVIDFISSLPSSPKHVCVSPSGGIRDEVASC